MEAVGLKWLHMVLLKDQNERASLGFLRLECVVEKFFGLFLQG